jgi:hypothetical protein
LPGRKSTGPCGSRGEQSGFSAEQRQVTGHRLPQSAACAIDSLGPRPDALGRQGRVLPDGTGRSAAGAGVAAMWSTVAGPTLAFQGIGESLMPVGGLESTLDFSVIPGGAIGGFPEILLSRGEFLTWRDNT